MLVTTWEKPAQEKRRFASDCALPAGKTVVEELVCTEEEQHLFCSLFFSLEWGNWGKRDRNMALMERNRERERVYTETDGRNRRSLLVLYLKRNRTSWWTTKGGVGIRRSIDTRPSRGYFLFSSSFSSLSFYSKSSWLPQKIIGN